MSRSVEEGATDIVLVAPNLGDGGTQRVVTVLARALHERGQGVCVVTLYRGPDDYELPEGVRRIAIATDEIPWFLRLPGEIRERIVADLDRLWQAMPSLFGGRVARRFRSWGRVLGRGMENVLDRVLAISQRWLPLQSAWRFHLPTLSRVYGLRRVVDELQPRRLVAFGGSTNLITVLACAGKVPRLVISERNDPARQALREPWNAMRPRLYRHADVVTANSQGALDAMRGYVDRRRLRYVPNPLWESDGDGDVAPGEPCFRLLIVGRLHFQKAHDLLFDALARIGAEIPEWRLSIVGSGSEEGALRDLADTLGIAPRIDWHGQVRDPYPHYRAAQVFVLPSRHEGMPNALLEAMSVGLPVIVSDASPGPLELIRSGETGLVVPVGDAGALARAIRDLAVDADLRRRLGTAAARAVDKHRLPNALAEWEALLETEAR